MGSFHSPELAVRGWVRTLRVQKSTTFLELNDGSGPRNLQVVWGTRDAAAVVTGTSEGLGTGASVRVCGVPVAAPKPGQPVELAATSVEVVGGVYGDAYPVQRKAAHTPEFLRSLPHLRPRTAPAASVLRVRAALAHAASDFFRAEAGGFTLVHTPVLTGNDCEGGGQLFAALPAADLAAAGAAGAGAAGAGAAHGPPHPRPPAERFFGKPVYLTVSGQLHLEAFAASLGHVYSFGPTFRAEDSHTTRHAAEFWMLEPEMVHAGLGDAVALAERCVKALAGAALAARGDDVDLLTDRVDPGLRRRLEAAAAPGAHFPVLTYDEAVAALECSGRAFDAPVAWEAGLATEHERYLAEELVRGPLFVTGYPAAIKPFYMRAADGSPPEGHPRATVDAFDLLVPGQGELAGGSAREARHDVLARRMRAGGLLSPARAAALDAPDGGLRAPPADTAGRHLDWYLDLRRFGGVPTAGFGLGFERLVMFATGMSNIRDVLPVPRVPDSCRM